MTPNNKFLLKILAAGVLIFLASKILPVIEESTGGFDSSLILQVLFFVILLWFIIKAGAPRFNNATYTSILLWILILSILIIAYAFRFELDSFNFILYS